MSGTEKIATTQFFSTTGDSVDKLDLKDGKDRVEIQFADTGLKISNWVSYEFSTDWSDAGSSWTCSLADDGDFKDVLATVQNGQRITLFVNGAAQCTGYVERWSTNTDRHSGTVLTLQGRDSLAPACESHVSRKFKFASVTTVKQLLTKLFAPYGFTDVQVDDAVNIQRLTGKSTPKSRTRTIDVNTVFSGLKSVKFTTVSQSADVELNKKWKPHEGEGVYQFAERIGKRFGFHIWPSADGKTLYTGQPDYSRKPIYTLTHRNGAAAGATPTWGSAGPNNVIRSNVTYDWANQPTVIVCTGAGGGHTTNYQPLEVIMVNELVTPSTPTAAITELLKLYPKAKPVPRRAYLNPPSQILPITKFAKLLEFHDDESRTYDHLFNFARNTMAQHQSHFMRATYVVEGHSQDGVVWTPNTMVTVHDDVNQIDRALWVKSRTFHKDRAGGATTTLELLLPHSLEFWPDGG